MKQFLYLLLFCTLPQPDGAVYMRMSTSIGVRIES